MKDYRKKNSYQVFCILLMLCFISCEKESPLPSEELLSPTTGTRTEFTLDSIYLYARQLYLWNEAIPSYYNFNPRKYTSISPDITAFRTALFDISQLKLNPATSLPFELTATSGLSKYSYLESGNSTGTLAATGTSNQEAVLKTSLITSQGKQIAYIAMGSFPSLANSKTALDNAFTTFSAAKPKYIVIDIRSNGGGYVETAEYVANLIASTALNGKVMYTEEYSPLLQNGKATLLKNQVYYDDEGKTILYNGRMATMADVDFTSSGNTHLFSKKGSMESIAEIYFIVSSHTASASELLISTLKPYFKVYLIGEQTYGKPVGFFPVNIDTYSVYIPSFILKNSQGWSDYYNGITPDIPVTMIDNPILGAPEEACLKAAIMAINSGSVTNSTTGATATDSNITFNTKATVSSLKTITNPINVKAPQLPGMIETRHHLKKQD